MMDKLPAVKSSQSSRAEGSNPLTSLSLVTPVTQNGGFLILFCCNNRCFHGAAPLQIQLLPSFIRGSNVVNFMFFIVHVHLMSSQHRFCLFLNIGYINLH